MCGGILGKTDNCLSLGNLQKRSGDIVKEMRMAEKGQQLCMFLSVFINIHVKKGKKREISQKGQSIGQVYAILKSA